MNLEDVIQLTVVRLERCELVAASTSIALTRRIALNLPEYGFVLQNFWNNANQHVVPDPFGMVK